MNPGQRFHEWAMGCRVREIDPRAMAPNRSGLYAIERAEEYADLAMAKKPTSRELLAYVAGIGRAYR